MNNINHGYRSQIGGHAPGDLRDALIEWIEAGNPATIEVCDESHPLRWLLGQLWNCTDILPGVFCDELELSRGSTYAKAVRHIAGTLTA